jgi:gamma-glutamyltranspeptidase/glutathione hydrolase
MFEQTRKRASIYLDAAGNPWPLGHKLKNPAYAKTLRAIAADGPRALTQRRDCRCDRCGGAARAARGHADCSDLQAFKPRRLDPLCGAYRVYQVCTMPSPASANAMLSILSLYERARPQPEGPEQSRKTGLPMCGRAASPMSTAITTWRTTVSSRRRRRS